MPRLCPGCHTDQVMQGGKTKVHIWNTTTSRRSCIGVGRMFRHAWSAPWPSSMCWSNGMV